MDKKVTNQLTIEVPTSSFVDEGEGVVSFPNGLTITDSSVQRNGTVYDMDSLDISRYGGQLTGDHEDKLSSLIGETIGTVKRDGKVVVNKIRYAIKENPYARLAYNLLVGGFSKNFSTETIGPAPDHTGIYRNAELVGLSQVVTQNNYNAHINKVVHNSLEQSKNDGLNVAGIEQKILNTNAVEKETNMENNQKETETQVTETQNVEEVKATESTKVQAPAVADAQDDEAKKIVETPHHPERPVGEVQQDEQKQADAQNKESEETKNEVDEDKSTEEVSEDEKETNNKENQMDEKEKNSVDTAALIAEAVKNALAPLTQEVASLREEQKNAFDKSAVEPEFKKAENEVKETAKNAYAAMDFKDRYQAQVDAAWNAVKMGNVEAWQKLRDINAVNLEELKKAGIARNAMTLEDLGNFVIAPEMYNEIAGVRTDYAALLNATEWRETMSLEFAWLQRTGDIDMRSVALAVPHNDDGTEVAGQENANLKPMSGYSATPMRSSLEELAAVTVVATSATRFAAVDLLADAAAGYRNDYDRKRAQLVIARLEQAVVENGFATGYAPTEDVDALTAWIDAITSISDTTLNGTLIFNARTFAELKSRALRAGANGPLSEILTTGNLPTVFGYSFVVVPNDLMPSLGRTGEEPIGHEVDGVNVPITHAVFFADLSTFTGRTSGGLQYDVSNSAPYEVGGVTRSAYQRNELVLRGSFFRGGAVKDMSVVAGVLAGAAPDAS